MNNSTPGDVTLLLRECSHGNQEAFDAIWHRYSQVLHQQAVNYLHRFPNRWMQPTMLVDDVLMKLRQKQPPTLQNRDHFLAWAKKTMKHLIFSDRRRSRAAKRGEAVTMVPLEEADGAAQMPMSDDIAVHEALRRMNEVNPLYGQIVVLRYGGGLTIEEVAQVLQLKPDRVKTLSQAALTWLRLELTEGHLYGH